MGTASLEVVEGLEAVEVGGGLRERVEGELVDGKLVLGVVGDKLESATYRGVIYPPS